MVGTSEVQVVFSDSCCDWYVKVRWEPHLSGVASLRPQDTQLWHGRGTPLARIITMPTYQDPPAPWKVRVISDHQVLISLALHHIYDTSSITTRSRTYR